MRLCLCVAGVRKLDFICSFSVHNVGHNHPHVVNSIVQAVTNERPAILHCCYVPEIAGNLAQMLVERANVTGACLNKVLFVNSGTESIETAIKFSRSHTRRGAILYVQTAFHGLTCGALSLNTSTYWTENFGPLLKDVTAICLNDIAALRRELSSGKYAAFIMEPILAEAGLYPPSREFLVAAQELCRANGTMLVFDEVQTGMYRTGTFLLFHQYEGIYPDMVCMAKALSGGLLPVGCLLMSDAIYNSVIHSTKKSFVQVPTVHVLKFY
jgi:ornithine--oxo-acid transaminase